MLKAKSINLLICLTFVAGTAHAGGKGDEVLARMDAAMTRAKDQVFTYDLVTKEPGKAERTLNLEVAIKGDKWRHIKFTGPGDVKGMKVLVRSKSKMYVYMPAFRKVRRVASHAKEQGFMGTTFSHDDISTVRYRPFYSAKLLKETKTHWTIALTRIKGADVRYKTLEFDVLKKYDQPSEIRYFNDKGDKIKTELRTGYSCQGKICNAASMKMIDHVRNNASSEFVRKTWKTNTGVKDSFFSKRHLQRGR